MSRYMTAREAAEFLGVTVPTIYAYVSRGFIRSEETGDSRRTRRYYAEDIERLIAHKEAARNPEKAAGDALHLGMPVLESAITLITEDAVYYRGHDVAVLVAHNSFEQVLALLWTGDMHTEALRSQSQAWLESCLLLLESSELTYLTPVQAIQMLLPAAASIDITAYDLSPEAVMRSATRILHLMLAVATGDMLARPPVASALARAWSPVHPAAEKLLNAALILCADHELNASSFSARVVAGAGASPYAVVSGAISAFQGIKHGGATELAGSFFRELVNSEGALGLVSERLRQGQGIPGFGHPVYVDGDPRARVLLNQLALLTPDHPVLGLVVEISNRINRAPNIDAALAAMALILDIDQQQAMLTFAIGRTAGWIAHALEQYDGRMIRPRARYVGPLPDAGK